MIIFILQVVLTLVFMVAVFEVETFITLNCFFQFVQENILRKDKLGHLPSLSGMGVCLLQVYVQDWGTKLN